jgi:hypothetical protein
MPVLICASATPTKNGGRLEIAQLMAAHESALEIRLNHGWYLWGMATIRIVAVPHILDRI